MKSIPDLPLFIVQARYFGLTHKPYHRLHAEAYPGGEFTSFAIALHVEVVEHPYDGDSATFECPATSGRCAIAVPAA